VRPPLGVGRDERQCGPEPPGEVTLGEALDESLRERSAE